ncbi:MAG: CRTAC1 family protein [Pseudomonadota bacterium]
MAQRTRTNTLVTVAVTLIAGCEDSPPPKDTAVARPAPAVVVPAPFKDVAAETGLGFNHFVGASGKFYMAEVMGAGAALLDFDLDGDLDVYLIQGAMLDRTTPPENATFPPPERAWPGNRLFRNDLAADGTLSFTDVTEGSGLNDVGYGMGATVGDIDNDGDPDLYLTNFGANRLFLNDGDGHFTDITEAAGVSDDQWSTAAGFHDYDRDGDLDLFVVDYVVFTPERNTVCTSPGGRRDYCGPQVYPPTSDRLFRNEGNGRFSDVTASVGLAKTEGPGLGLVWADFDGDGWTDAYVANDGAANFLWRNINGERFEDIGLYSGTAYNMMGSPEASMGVTAGDFDADGDEDLFMTHLIQESNTLYLNEGDGNFIDATDRFRLGASSMSLTGFGALWFDYDNDGFLDLIVANGNVKLEESRVAVSPYPFEQRNQLFRNDGGTGFDEISRDLDEFGRLEVSRGAALGDINNDGRLDVLITNNNGPARLLINTSEADHHWLSIRLEGRESPRDGTGARVAVRRDGQAPLWRQARTEGSYLSANDGRVHVGLGNSAAPVALEVHWPSGRVDTFSDIAADQAIVLTEGSGSANP